MQRRSLCTPTEKKLILLRNLFAEPIEELIAPFCEGWFGTEDRSQWRYRVKFA